MKMMNAIDLMFLAILKKVYTGHTTLLPKTCWDLARHEWDMFTGPPICLSIVAAGGIVGWMPVKPDRSFTIFGLVTLAVVLVLGGVYWHRRFSVYKTYSIAEIDAELRGEFTRWLGIFRFLTVGLTVCLIVGMWGLLK
jgi:hypothetical protein